MSINLPIPQTSAPFMFWCQKVLPLVYDDSLSYYEVLCKLVTYVNGLRDDVIKLGEDVSELNKLYNELAKLLDEYFNRGVQDSVNKKLDEMASDGYFDDILSKYITPFFAINFDTTENALAYHFSVGQTVHTNGYHSPTDGGACTFQVMRDAPTSGIKTVNGLFLVPANANSVITPEMYGAFGDGVQDDTVALQKAINLCCIPNISVNFCGTKGKIYSISAPIDINQTTALDNNGVFDFKGAKIRAIAKMKYALSYKTTGYADGVPVKHSKSIIKNLAIDCNNELAHTGLYAIYTAGNLFDNINVYGCRRGIYLAGGVESEIRNCTVRRNAEDDIYTALKNGTIVENFPQTNRGEFLNDDDKINLDKTQCVGFEMTTTDSFITNCVSIDCVIGIKIVGGDNKIVGCHPWNAFCVNQIYSSCCLYESGSVFSDGLTCDRFYIGIYHNFNAPSFYSNTLFTNQPMTTLVGDSVDLSPVSYCLYLSEKYALKSNGADFKMVNTKVHGDRNVNSTNISRILKWCNVKFNAVDIDIFNSNNLFDFFAQLDTKNNVQGGMKFSNVDSLNSDCYASVKSVAKTIELPTICDNNLFSGSVTSGHAINTIFANNCSITVDDNKWVSMTSVPIMEKTAYMVIGSKGYGTSVPFDLIQGHTYIVSLLYKSTNNNALIYLSNATDGLLPPSNPLTHDGKEQLYFNMFTYNGKFVWSAGFNDPSNVANFAIKDIRIYDITDLPRYFLESTGAYFNRITNFLGNSMISVVTDVRDDVSFVATPFKIDFGVSPYVVQGAQNYDPISDYYTVRYDRNGKPMIWSHKSSIAQTGHATLVFDNVASLDFNKNRFLYLNSYIKDYKNCFDFRVYQNGIFNYTISGSNADGEIAPAIFDGKVELFLRNKERTDGTPARVTSFFANYDDTADSPIFDNKQMSAIYKNGGLYPILKGSGEDEDYMRELPTIAYEIDVIL
jgi:hypothetical protein